jgi:DtxR family transcriptional regulator, Mn-dependent transcriptional regulator
MNIGKTMSHPRFKIERYRSVDRYLHALLLLTTHGQQVDTGDLAAKVGVSDAAASHMLKTLESKKLVKLEPYEGAELTPEGLHRALRVIRRHRLIEVWLHQVMKFDLNEIHARATAMQSLMDQTLEDKFDEILGHPKYDPHGQPIPGKNATWLKLTDSPLLDLTPGTIGKVSRITTDDKELLRYLAKLGIRIGEKVIFHHLSPFEGPVSVQVGDKTHHIGRKVAATIYLEPAESS